MARGFGLRAAVVLGVGLLAGCSDDDSGDTKANEPECSADGDCGNGMRCGYDGACYETWGCVGTNDWPTTASAFNVHTRLARIDSGSVSGGVTAIACVNEDVSCTAPTVTSDRATLDATGVLTIPFTSKFSGTVRISPQQAGQFVPTVVHVTAATPWVTELVTEKPTLLASQALLALLPAYGGTSADPGSIAVGVDIYDCGGRPAPGVTVAVPSTSNARFVPLNSNSVPLTAGQPTDDFGKGILANLAPNGLISFDLAEASSQRKLGTVNVIPVADAYNTTTFYPSYAAVKAWMKEYDRQQKQ